MAALPSLDQVRRAPKVLLHDHLDGGLRPTTVIELAREVGPHAAHHRPRRAGAVVHRGRLPPRPRPLPRDVRAHRRASCRPRTPCSGWRPSAPRTWRTTASSTPRCASPPSCTSRAGSRSTRWSRRCSRGSASAAPAAASRSAPWPPPCATPPTPARSPSWRCATATTGVVGFDIAGSEAGNPPTRHLAAFQEIAKANSHITIHAGEAFGLPSIWEALQLCGAERLGHGVRIVDDITVDDEGRATLGRLAAFVRDRRVPLEMCPTSNVHTGVAPSIAEHPIGLLTRLRFRVTVNTDNRLMSDITHEPTSCTTWSRRSASAGTRSSGSRSTP